MSGFAALDMKTQEARHPGDIGAQAEVTFGPILTLLAHAGLGPTDLLETAEYCVESAIREDRAPWPASESGC